VRDHNDAHATIYLMKYNRRVKFDGRAVKSTVLSFGKTVEWAFILTALAVSAMYRTRAHAQSVVQVKSRLVTVNAVVTDRLGNSINDLTQNDFTILDGGHSQKVQFFSKIENDSFSTYEAPPDTYSNSYENGTAMPNSATVILFDTLYSHWTSQGYGLQRVRAFLRQLDPKDRIGVYVLGDNLEILHEYAKDSTDLIAAIHDYDSHYVPATNAAEQSSTGIVALDRFLTGSSNRWRAVNDASKMPNSEAIVLRHEMFRTMLIALRQIASHLEAVPGRKALIWVTDNIPSPLLSPNVTEDTEDIYRRFGEDLEVDEMVREMNRAGIAVYPVSAEGLQTMDLQFRDRPFAPDVKSPGPFLTTPPNSHPEMEELAARTGGRALYNRNDLETGIAKAMKDSRVSYSLAYAPDHNKWKGEFRTIKVKVDRPDATVLARGGYFALPDPKPSLAKEEVQRMAQLADSPLDAAGLPFSAHLAGMVTASGMLQLKLLFAPNIFLSAADDGKWRGNFDAVVLQLSAN